MEGAFTIEDIKYKEDCWCEHCGELEPYTATFEDGCDWCVDCGLMGDLALTKEEQEKIRIEEARHKVKYFAERIESLHKFLIEKE